MIMKKKRWVWLLIIVFFVFTGVMIWSALTKWQVGANIVHHNFIYTNLEKIYDEGNELPASLKGLVADESQFIYAPSAWTQPDCVLVESNIRGCRCKTFGNGDIVCVKGRLIRKKSETGSGIFLRNRKK